MLRIHTFGGCYIERDGARLDAVSGQRKGLALLALLAGSGERGMSREVLLAYLWPDSDEERARTSLKQLVHSLRSQLSAPELLMPSAELRLNGEVITSDVGELRAAARRDDNETVASLYDGPFLDGFYLKAAGEFEQWVAGERTELERLAARAFVALAEQATARGDHRAAVEWWRRLAQIEPLSARAATGLMLALDAAGERAAALSHARIYEILVREQVGGTPDAAVVDLVGRLQRGEPTTQSMSKRSTTKQDVVPTVAETKNGLCPCFRSWAMARSSASGRIANVSSTSIARMLRRPMPAMPAAFSSDECAWVEV